MTNPAAEKKAIEIVNAFMDTEFDEEAEASIWLIRRIRAALEQFEEAAKGDSATSSRRSLSFGPPARPVAHQEPHRAGAVCFPSLRAPGNEPSHQQHEDERHNCCRAYDQNECREDPFHQVIMLRGLLWPRFPPHDFLEGSKRIGPFFYYASATVGTTLEDDGISPALKGSYRTGKNLGKMPAG
jgi:hypothetical protein